MKKTLLALLALMGAALQQGYAGSAVAMAPPGHLVSMYGHSKAVSIQEALNLARLRYGANVKLLAATDVTGYGAIAVAHHFNGENSLIGVALGMRSATEANTVAIQQCLKAGGKNPQVKWAWRG